MPHHTPLYGVHRSLGARMIEFGGWEMPVQYRGILAEHHAVRTAAGLFDLSHMGEIAIAGPRALEVCQELLVTDAARIQLWQAQYSVMCYPDGGIVDDVIVYRIADDHYFVCVNAANDEKDFAWIVEHNRGRAQVARRSDDYVLIAIQGPQSRAILQRLTTTILANIRRYWCTSGVVAGVPALLARTGYTGEDGFELFVPARQGVTVWNACLEAGNEDGLIPVGLGARDTLRLEAAYLLYGNDIDATTTPLEARLQRLVRFEKEHFVGREALLQQQVKGVTRQLVGIKMEEAGIPRHGYALYAGEREVGHVTSGTQSPTLGVGIALGYVATEVAGVGQVLAVDIRGRRAGARVVETPFYRLRAQQGA